ncbi:hypothetical protein Hanom_Chr00s000001g01592181 [Helianthus anomalus]
MVIIYKVSGTVNKPPQLIKVSQYVVWKEEFEAFVQSEDSRMWSCMIDGQLLHVVLMEEL